MNTRKSKKLLSFAKCCQTNVLTQIFFSPGGDNNEHFFKQTNRL